MTYHVPALLNEVTDALRLAPGKRILDATLGGGGHARAIAQRIAPGGLLIGLDQDAEALAEARKTLDVVDETEIRLHQVNFADLSEAMDGDGLRTVDGALFDLGVSSHQLDTPERGFAIRYVGPLDMRMAGTAGGETAAELLNRLPEAEIARILFEFGEEPRGKRIAAEIVRRRAVRPLETTEDLTDAVRAAMPFRTRPGEIHPATKVFQAVRIAVNRELDILEGALRAAAGRLAAGGRLAVISYHSLEDRIVKKVMAELAGKRVESDLPSPQPLPPPILMPVTRKPITPTEEEVRSNPRARSAKLRVAERIGSEP
ncbi:MAG: 16S rRNA (cytosine(1402)-N(4))-methyltransferase RsmH [Capsulimonadales bacterium]|nr:16S rRNA (cytosine(1402)-N(4))-methyltransferase RsmH [Capsulimonadales bacterium]